MDAARRVNILIMGLLITGIPPSAEGTRAPSLDDGLPGARVTAWVRLAAPSSARARDANVTVVSASPWKCAR